MHKSLPKTTDGINDLSPTRNPEKKKKKTPL